MDFEKEKFSLKELLCCPICNGDLQYINGKKDLFCSSCNKRYIFKNGIFVLLPE